MNKFDLLKEAFYDNSLTPEEQEELLQWLDEDQDNLMDFVRDNQINWNLKEIYHADQLIADNTPAEQEEKQPVTFTKWHMISIAGTVAALIILLFIIPGNSPVDPVTKEGITVLTEGKVQLKKGNILHNLKSSEQLKEGDQLIIHKGSLLTVKTDNAEIKIKEGSVILGKKTV